jgi:hypothetical protein
VTSLVVSAAIMGSIAFVVMLWDLCRDLVAYRRAEASPFFGLASLVIGSAIAGFVATNILELIASLPIGQ